MVSVLTARMELRPGIAPGVVTTVLQTAAFTCSLAQRDGNGAPGRSFTFTLPGKSRRLWKLSYGRGLRNLLAAGIAPAASAFAERRSGLMSYASLVGKMLPDVVPPHEDLVNSQA